MATTEPTRPEEGLTGMHALEDERRAARHVAQEIVDGKLGRSDLSYVDAMAREVVRLLRERDEARAELARVQRLPALPWAEASAEILRLAAQAARQGYRVDAKAMQAALDKAKTYVSRLCAERDEARALVADMQSRIRELTEDARAAREAATPAPWRSLGQVIRGEGGS